MMSTDSSFPLPSGPATVDKHSSIAHKILLYILLFSSFSTLLVSMALLYSDYREQADMIDQRMKQIELSYQDSLTNAVWFFNEKQIENILGGIMQFEDVHYVGVSIHRGDAFHQGVTRQDKNTLRYEVDIKKTVQDNVMKIGHLSIESNLEGVIQRLKKKFWTILAYQALTTFLVAIFILSIMYFLVTRHLIAIADFTNTLDIKQKNKFLKLNKSEHSRPNELDQIIQAINQMKKNLIEDEAEREESDRKLRKLSQAVEQSTASILILDAEGKIDYVNPKFETSTGYTLKEVYGKTSNLLIFGEKDEKSYKEIWKIISSGQKWRGEIHSQRKDKTRFLEQASISSITEPDKGITHYLILKDDISDLRQAEQDLRHAQKMEAVGQLTGGIAHDFNNILGIIQGNLELLKLSVEENEKAQSRIEKALHASGRATDLTSKLLLLSKKEDREVSYLSINDLVGDIEYLISKSLTDPIGIRTLLSNDLWLVNVNPGDFEDAILNLSINARDAMPEGGTITIETSNQVIDRDYVKLHPQCKTGEFVLLSINDTGTGMSEAVKSKSLHPFFTTKEKGMGLGLSMVYAFVQRSGGHLVIDSEIGLGTTVHIFLPRAFGVSETPHHHANNTTELPTGTETILIVDDEEDIRDIACAYLQQLGYNVLSAENATQALQIIRNEERVDLLFSDIIMPGEMDGYKLAAKAKEYDPNLSIILASGYVKKRTSEITDDDNLIQSLANNMLRKPYNKSGLALAVNKALTANR